MTGSRRDLTKGKLILVKPANDAADTLQRARLGESGSCSKIFLLLVLVSSESPTLHLSLGERCPTFYPESLGAFCLVKRGETNQEEICDP